MVRVRIRVRLRVRARVRLWPCLVALPWALDSYPTSEAWPHHERAVSTWLCLQNTWVPCTMCIQSDWIHIVQGTHVFWRQSQVETARDQSIEKCCPSMLFSACLLQQRCHDFAKFSGLWIVWLWTCDIWMRRVRRRQRGRLAAARRRPDVALYAEGTELLCTEQLPKWKFMWVCIL